MDRKHFLNRSIATLRFVCVRYKFFVVEGKTRCKRSRQIEEFLRERDVSETTKGDVGSYGWRAGTGRSTGGRQECRHQILLCSQREFFCISLGGCRTQECVPVDLFIKFRWGPKGLRK